MDHDYRDKHYQPPMEVVDLTSSDSESDSSSSGDSDHSEEQRVLTTSARRYGWYRTRYLELFERFFTEACECQLAALDGSPGRPFAEMRDLVVDDFIWKLMDRDLQIYKGEKC